MTANNKSARRVATAKDISTMHLKGNKGPAATLALHGKARSNRMPHNVMPRPVARMSVRGTARVG